MLRRAALPTSRRARASEDSFWACSCLPKSDVYTRMNIHWQEVLSAWTHQEGLLFSFHTALTPLSIGPLLTDRFRVCNKFELSLTREATYVDGGETGGRIGEVLADLVE